MKKLIQVFYILIALIVMLAASVSADTMISSVAVSDNLIARDDIGNNFSVFIYYAIDMNTAINPSVVFIPEVSATLVGCAGEWINTSTFIYNCTIAGENVTEAEVDVNVSGGVNLSDITQDPYVDVDAFSVDTQAPYKLSATASPDPAKAGTVTVTIVFSENMDNATEPSVQVISLTSGPYAVAMTSYLDDTWIGTFTLADDDEETTADIGVNGAQDLAGNGITNTPYAGTFDVDTKAPDVYDSSFIIGPLGYGLLTDIDGFLSKTSPNNIINLSINITDATGVNNVTFDFSNVCSSAGAITKTSVGGDNLWRANCTVDQDANFQLKNITITTCDDLGNCNEALYRSVLLYNMTTPPPIQNPCERFGSLTTNFAQELNFNSVNFIIQVELNGSCLTGPGGGSSPWEGYEQVMMMNFTSLNMSGPGIGQRLAGLRDAFVVNVTPPHIWGPTRIYLNTTAFAELNTNTKITLNNLPFTGLPDITCLENGSRDAIDPIFTPQTPFTFTIQDYKGTGPAVISVPRGDLTFDVAGFSTYDVNESEKPTITIVSPATSTLSDSTVRVNVIVNGTGTDLSLIQITNLSGGADYVYNATSGNIEDSANCVNLTTGSNLLNCTILMYGVSQGSHDLTITANDFAYPSPGNTNSTAVTITIDNNAPNITVNSPTPGALTNDNTTNINFTFVDAFSGTSDCTVYIDGDDYGNDGSVANNTPTVITLSPAAPDGNHTLNINCTDEADNVRSSGPQFLIIDTVAPVVSLVSPADGIDWNSSSSPDLFYNVSDSLSSSFTCNLAWGGSTPNNQSFTGVDNASVDGNISAGYVLGLLNENVTWYINCTDEVGNKGQSSIRSFLVNDTFAPVISSLSPSGTLSSSTTSVTLSVATDEAASCKYSTSDVNYGNMTSEFTDDVTDHSATESVASSSSGIVTYTFYVRCQDVSNNTDNTSSTISFSLSKRSGGGGGGGGGSISNPSNAQNWTHLTPGSATIMKLNSDDYGVKEIIIMVSNPVKNMTIRIEKLAGLPASVTKNVTGKIYKYLKIDKTNLNDSDLNGTIKLKFSVTRTWLLNNRLDASNIVLKRYANGVWQDLKTTLLSRDNNNANYEAETPSFSYFAIGEKGAELTPVPKPAEEPATTTTTETGTGAATATPETKPVVQPEKNPAAAPTTTKAGSSKGWQVAIVIIVVIAIALVIFTGKGKGKGLKPIREVKA